MKTIPIPYHTSSLDVHVAQKNLKAVIAAKLQAFRTDKSEADLVREALASPIGGASLAELARGRKKVVLVTSDHTRAMPSRITIPLLLEEIRKGNPAAEITILIATGLHRPTTKDEQRRMFGDAIVDNEIIAVNDAFRPDDFVRLCRLPSGAEFCVNRLAAECDLLLAEGFIEPHFFAGFSGGRKSILPGICSEETVNENHSFKAIASPFAVAGVLERNPIHEDMVYAARRVNTRFILNVALDERKKIIAAFAGDLEEAHVKGCEFIRSLSECPPVAGDIVITSNGGYPLDQNLYQTPKAISTAVACAKEGGVIILCAACSEGMGGTHFEKLMLSGGPAGPEAVEAIEAHLAGIAPKQTIPEQWCVQVFARILKKHPVIVVTTGLDHDLIRRANMIPASSPDEALAMAYAMKGAEAEVVVIPDGVAVLAGGHITRNGADS